MKTKFGYLSVLLAFILLSMNACSGTKSTAESTTSTKEVDKEMKLKDSETSQEFALETYLSRTPGVTVRGSGQNAVVQVRGVNSFGGNTEPLFVVNGNAIGSNYSNVASLLRGMKIQSVEVLKGSDASLYGARGAGGVIVIKAQ